MVEAYRIARHAAELEREAVCKGGAEEERDYGPIITFKDWICDYWPPEER